jgi:hypothetical protein
MIENATLDILLLKYALLALFVERAVCQIKAIWRTDLFGSTGPARPWPLFSFIAAGAVVYGWSLYVIGALIGHGPTGAEAIMGFVDWFVSTLSVAGGSAGVIDLIKGVRDIRAKAQP